MAAIRQRIRLDSFWRFGDSGRHKVKAIAFDMSRDNSRTFDRDIEWGGDIYPVDAKVDAEFSFTVIEVAYEYAFLKRDNYELDGSIGLHYTDLSTSLKAKAESSGGALDEDISNSASVAAPLPVIGLRGIWDLSHNFWLDATAQFFALSIDESTATCRTTACWSPGSRRSGWASGSGTTSSRWTWTSTKTISTVRSTGPTAAR